MNKLKSILTRGFAAAILALSLTACGSFESTSKPHAAISKEPAPPTGQGGDYSTIKSLWKDHHGDHLWAKMDDGMPYHTTIIAANGQVYTCSVSHEGWVTWFKGTRMIKPLPQETVPAEVIAQAKHDIYAENMKREPKPLTPEEQARMTAMSRAFSGWQAGRMAESEIARGEEPNDSIYLEWLDPMNTPQGYKYPASSKRTPAKSKHISATPSTQKL